MKLVMIHYEGDEQACIKIDDRYVRLHTINQLEHTHWPINVFDLLQEGQLETLTAWYNEGGSDKLAQLESVPSEAIAAAPLYRHPRKIWGIGMNYVKQAEEREALFAEADPVSFMKPDTSLIGPNTAIELPAQQTEHVTAEAELAIIIGRTCKNITEAEALGCVAGFAVSVDVTAADIHAKHQRFLTRAKSFDTFFGFGSELITRDEIEDLSQLAVETWHNGELAHRNVLANMIYQPAYLVAFHSQVMTLLPGDVILTGTPGAVVIRDGDVIEARIPGFEPLLHPVQAAAHLA
ncbi:2-keto-4-pentenoate hydratase/2-oxohepta-3-ene-1,7-dioic acid hydratase (catechol pathway) [Paenibacillus algorifonticola]|uniref:2-keto-4-pentenoate hydratase/2-oxohepta-3-ene-1,7-dioic acid hydratase (Catechol pathway) n=1 Tax=Paenibacillus algorifonticola TaxID=684063 RepID=A0A1I2GB48_9BACL|nr:fumarylacetoacetate hydrolase family protein [Paenibacillus algorifonticola]SFF13891.1 2-keto-4-pentenoate hydratase/2-oxohepta-3-ene-1,7-dioic acid hydratase (catechol pathway) [Paenibacillus algorifonticola]